MITPHNLVSLAGPRRQRLGDRRGVDSSEPTNLIALQQLTEIPIDAHDRGAAAKCDAYLHAQAWT